MTESTSDLATSKPELPVSPEVKNVFPYPYIDKKPEELTSTERYINSLSKGLWAWDVWAHAKTHDFDNELPQIVVLNRKIQDMSRYTRNLPVADANANPDTLAAEIDALAGEMLNQRGEVWPPGDPSYIKGDQKGAKITLALQTFGRMYHDAALMYTPIDGYQQLIKRALEKGMDPSDKRITDRQSKIEGAFDNLRAVFKNGRDALLDEFHKRPIALYDIYQTFERKLTDYFSENYSIKVRKGEFEGDPNWQTSYAFSQLDAYVENQARNIRDEYIKLYGEEAVRKDSGNEYFVDISSKIVKDEVSGKPIKARVNIDDYAGGYDESVLEDQFQHQITTKVTGTGTGNNYQQEVLTTKYDARMIAENRPDGGRTILELPLTSTETKNPS